MNNEILFTERQKFKQWWLWAILLGINGITFYRIFKHGGLENITSNGCLLVALIVSLLLLVFFYLFRVDTVIKSDGIYVRFFPFHLKYKHYAWQTIANMQVRKYSPLAEYGGWGIRYSSNGKAYNISGNQGLQIQFNNDKKLLIGTNKSAELAGILPQVEQLKNKSR